MSKTVVEDCKKVQMWWLKKHGYLNGHRWGGIEWTNGYDDSKSSIGFTVSTNKLFIQFDYTQTDYPSGQKTYLDYKFDLVTTPCNYGGVRYWFICGLYKNGQYCGRRVAKIYKPPGTKWFGCRYCWDLSYEERQKNRGSKYRALFGALEVIFKAEKLGEKIKRRYWRGKPTRKYRRLLKYGNVMNVHMPLAKSIKT